ncbi:cell wall protein DAN4 [Scaptodrosophila lebanonensis]|uniref:Cell wall protein DAN4 n=1 Tax=Drosophila lebanonensis TaxID=7225 RepID=A0A6J2UIP0_DROLE|nr:cell wall protein DAN4 [Scaptodrosophila lebanonensis]
MTGYLFIVIFINYALIVSSNESDLLTQTVYGFLDFTTTIGNTVMVFSPQSSPQLDLKINKTSSLVNAIQTKPLLAETKKGKEGIKPTKSSAPPSSQSLKAQSEILYRNNVTLSQNTINLNTSSSPIDNVMNIPEYDLLSRQPEEFAEETYRLFNLKSKGDTDRQRIFHSTRDNHPTGLVTKISETYTKNGQPIVKETNVLGTYISGKYAQILQAGSVIKNDRNTKIRPTSSARILKTGSPSIQPSRITKETHSSQNGFTKHHRKNTQVNREPTEKSKGTTSTRKSSRNKGKRRNKSSSTSSSSISPTSTDPSSRRLYRTKATTSAPEYETTPGQYTFKLNRRPGRWQYKSSPKPKVNIRKQSSSAVSNYTLSNDFTPDNTEENQIQKIIGQGRDLEASGSQNGPGSQNSPVENDEIKPKNFVQTLNVEISTPNNFVDTYYEIATIKSPFIFQAGVVKKTRFLTVTSTIEKVIKDEHTEEYSEDDGPLTENILDLATKPSPVALDGSVTTLNPIFISDSSETPILETVTESYSITQTKLKTQILPIINEKLNETKLFTLIQTYDYTSLITVTQTLSPLGDSFNPSKNFKDFEGNLDEAGSEFNLDLEFGDEDNTEQFEFKAKSKLADPKTGVNATDNYQIGTLSNLEKNQVPLPIINTLNPQNSVITSTRPVIKMETIWESYVVPLIKGTDTILRTLSKSVGVAEKTDYVTEISTVMLPATQFPFSINPYNPYNPLLPIPPQPHLITSTEILQTTLTETNSKVLKLTFGARTAYTTIYSTAVKPTAVTRLVTTALPIQNTASFPNYYPHPFPPFAYVG